MELVHIVPHKYLPLVVNKEWQFVVSPDVSVEQIHFLNHQKGTYKIIVDNGAFEGKAEAFGKVMECALRLDGKVEVVLPDVLFDAESTKLRIHDVLPLLKEFPQFSWMVVPQGSNVIEYQDCVSWCLQLPIQTIGFSYVAIFKSLGTGGNSIRASFIHKMNHALEFETYDKKFHCLGLGRSPFELEFLKSIPYIRSCDSSLAARATVQHIDLSNVMGRDWQLYQRRPEYFFLLKDLDETLLLHNINFLDDVVSGKVLCELTWFTAAKG